jgi:lipoprotein-releasing system ATP-binding protein
MMIEARNIIKRYGDLEVLRGVDLDIVQGEIVSIVGPSGAGKTTLLHIIGTLDTPQAGEVSYDGKNVLTLRDRELAHFRNRNIGFVFQFHQLLPEFTMLENVAIPALLGGDSRSDAYDRARRLLERMHLGDRLDHKPSQLSGGECQRVAVARALINSPKVILADEPSGSLDTQNKQELHRLFFDLRDRYGQPFVIVTNDEQLASITDRTIHLRDGLIEVPKTVIETPETTIETPQAIIDTPQTLTPEEPCLNLENTTDSE